MTTRWRHIIEQVEMTQQFCSAQVRIRMFFYQVHFHIRGICCGLYMMKI